MPNCLESCVLPCILLFLGLKVEKSSYAVTQVQIRIGSRSISRGHTTNKQRPRIIPLYQQSKVHVLRPLVAAHFHMKFGTVCTSKLLPALATHQHVAITNKTNIHHMIVFFECLGCPEFIQMCLGLKFGVLAALVRFNGGIPGHGA